STFSVGTGHAREELCTYLWPCARAWPPPRKASATSQHHKRREGRNRRLGSSLTDAGLLDFLLDRFGSTLPFAYRFAKAADGPAQVGAQAAQALGAEQHDHNQQNDQKLPDADTHHFIHPLEVALPFNDPRGHARDRKSTRLNSSHVKISYAV